MGALRLLLLAGWAGLAAITLWALLELGVAAAPATFVSDLAHPWRAQFYADFELHLLLVAGWILWREQWRPLAWLFAVATMLLGALFTFPYILFAAARAKGDPAVLLLGRRRGAARHD